MSTIPEFFQAKKIFVTGGTGFIGKVLLEKILRSCPDVGNIYMLLRPKRGKDLKERLTDLTNIPVTYHTRILFARKYRNADFCS
jgi:thioester reductase-like protein